MSGRSRSRRKYRGPWPTDELGVDRGDKFPVTLGPMNERGEMWSEYKGFRVLVEGGIEGESVTVEILRRFPEHLGTRVVEVAEASSDRVQPECPYTAVCTGCQWQHVRYERQLQFKQAMVSDALASEASVKDARGLPTLPSPLPPGYRTPSRSSVRRTRCACGCVTAPSPPLLNRWSTGSETGILSSLSSRYRTSKAPGSDPGDRL